MPAPAISESDLLKMISDINPRASRREVAADANLFAKGILDSLTTVQLVLSLEERYGITFDYTDITIQGFQTLGSLKDLLCRRYGFSAV